MPGRCNTNLVRDIHLKSVSTRLVPCHWNCWLLRRVIRRRGATRSPEVSLVTLRLKFPACLLSPFYPGVCCATLVVFTSSGRERDLSFLNFVTQILFHLTRFRLSLWPVNTTSVGRNSAGGTGLTSLLHGPHYRPPPPSLLTGETVIRF